VLTLAFIGLVGGLITGVSPCVLPMLPIIFIAGGDASAQKDRFRPLKIILGVIVAFSIIALLGSAILSALGLPDDTLRYIGFVVLTVVGLGMLFPALGHLIEKPFYRLPKLSNGNKGPFVLGLGLGTLYVPCAGPILAAIIVAGATGQIGFKTVVLTVAFAIGAAIPLLFFAAAGARISERVKAYRSRDRAFRVGSGIVLIALSFALLFNITDVIQRNVPSYTSGLETKVASSKAVQGALTGLQNNANKELAKCTPGAAELTSCGQAPPFVDISRWYNTPGDKAIDVPADTRGKVLLVDFWAYSCINCQRDQPYLNAWYKAYHHAGLEVIGTQSAEFSFEKSEKNVQGAINREHIAYPVALDPNDGTFTQYRNQYWPAKYLVDQNGTVRAINFGESNYAQIETQIRQLLQDANPGVQLPAPVTKGVKTIKAGKDITPETYLAYSRATNYSGAPSMDLNSATRYAVNVNQPADTFSFGGEWKVGTQSSVPTVDGSQIRINANGSKVYNVVAGEGTITVSEEGQPDRTIPVSGDPTNYPIIDSSSPSRHTLTLTYSKGLQAFTFSFG
jgi:cytochrome c biogenesis protein CcdA/thiol-disulfide isomerase/thioredoxin